jgi:hypothetical protein
MEYDALGNDVLDIEDEEEDEDEPSYEQIRKQLWASPAPGEGTITTPHGSPLWHWLCINLDVV